MKAKALLSEHASKYMQARAIYRERKRYTEGILRNLLATPPDSGDKEEHQVALWKKLIAYEKTNPQRLENNALYNRVTFTFNQAVLCLYFYPEIWHDFAVYQLQTDHLDIAAQVFERATVAVPRCLLLHFAYADAMESQKKVKEAKDIYEKLVTNNSDTLAFIQYMKFAARTEV